MSLKPVFGLVALVYLVASLACRRLLRVRVAAALVCGFAGGAWFIWSLAPRDWGLPFWATRGRSV